MAARKKRVHYYDVPVLVAAVGLPRPGRSQRTPPLDGEEQQNKEHLDDDEPFEFKRNWSWLRPYIDGYSTVLKIAADTNVDKPIIKSCIKSLISHGLVTLIPILKFSNPYRATPNFNRLFYEHELQKSCLRFITNSSDSKDKPSLSDVFEVFSSLQQGRSLRAVCRKYAEVTNGPAFDIRRLVIFAQLHGLVECLKIYPVYFPNLAGSDGFNNEIDSVTGIRRLFNGRLCTDEICNIAGIYLPNLEQIIEDDPNVSIIWR